MLAVAVNGPLLVLSLLRADGVPLSLEWHITLVTIRALRTVIVMTVGSAFIAHVAAFDPESRWGLVALWLTLLAGTAFIVTPMVVEAVGRSLAQTIPSELGRWVLGGRFCGLG